MKLPASFSFKLLGAALALCLFIGLAHAEFAVAVSPPRFVLQAKPGELLRRTIDITNAAGTASTYAVKTADWTYGQDGSVSFSEELSPGSCRPWVAIERRQLTVQSGRPYRFRFEIAPQAGTVPTECRFALLIEGQDEKADAGGVAVPFAARMAVIVEEKYWTKVVERIPGT